MSVHKAITEHAQKQHNIVKKFSVLEIEREEAIEQAVRDAENQEEINVDKINRITEEMNELAKQGVVSQRKYVTVEMVRTYVNRK